MSSEGRFHDRLRFPLRQRGVTLVELILFIVIVGIALGGIITVMNLSTRGSADPVRRKQALIIAEGLLEEVELAKFSYCDPADPDASDASLRPNTAACQVPERWGQAAPEGGGAAGGRPYDNVNDYVSAPRVWVAAFDDSAGVLRDANGDPIDVRGYSARLMITPESLGNIVNPANVDTTADAEVLRITVQVSYDGQAVTLDGYRTRYAPNDV
jgi:MSHA pilin protein MshD